MTGKTCDLPVSVQSSNSDVMQLSYQKCCYPNLQPMATLITASAVCSALNFRIVKGSIVFFPFGFLCGQIHFFYNNSLYQDTGFDPNFSVTIMHHFAYLGLFHILNIN